MYVLVIDSSSLLPSFGLQKGLPSCTMVIIHVLAIRQSNCAGCQSQIMTKEHQMRTRERTTSHQVMCKSRVGVDECPIFPTGAYRTIIMYRIRQPGKVPTIPDAVSHWLVSMKDCRCEGIQVRKTHICKGRNLHFDPPKYGREEGQFSL